MTKCRRPLAKKVWLGPYKWTHGDEVIVVSLCNTGTNTNSEYTVPYYGVDPVLLRAVKALTKREGKKHFAWNLDVEDSFKDFFEAIPVRDKLTEDNPGDDEDDDRPGFDKEAVIVQIRRWVENDLSARVHRPPDKMVKVVAFVNLTSGA
jgi:hypothetical protein